MEFGYRLMRGKNGVSGFVRGMGEKALLSVRGLQPGELCSLYALQEGTCSELEQKKADREGRAQFMIKTDVGLFMAVQNKVALWEAEKDAEEQYLLACACLRRMKEQEMIKPREEPGFPGPDTQKEEDPETEIGKTDALTEHTAIEPSAGSETEQGETPAYTLRKAGSGEAVDTLPALFWPAGTEDERLNFARRTPFAPFRAPAWRFVKVPSPLPEAPFCAVGYRAEDDRVKEIAYAIPGLPERPPVSLPGYHYRSGVRGDGYWVASRRV